MKNRVDLDSSGRYVLSRRITACMTCGAPVRIGVHKDFSYDTKTFYAEPIARTDVAGDLANALFNHPNLVQVRKRLSCDDLSTIVKVLSGRMNEKV